MLYDLYADKFGKVKVDAIFDISSMLKMVIGKTISANQLSELPKIKRSILVGATSQR